MKGFTRICLLISLIFLCIGCVCLGIGAVLGSGLREVWAMAGNGELDVGYLHFGENVPFPYITDDISDEELQIEKGVVEESFLPQEVENLKINIKYGAVYVTDSQTDQIEISVDAPESNAYQCGLKDETLELLDKTPRYRWNALRNGIKNKVEITIAIPKGTVFDEVDLVTDAGGIEISHDLEAREIHFDLDAGELVAEKVIAAEGFSADVDAGNLEIAEFAAKSLEVDCGVGRAKLCGSVLEGVEADCGIGQIILQLKGREDDYDYDVDCGLGNVRINGTSYSGLSTNKEIDHHTGRTISLECGVGEIEVTVEEE